MVALYLQKFSTLTAMCVVKVLALSKKDSLGNKVVLALPYSSYTKTSVAFFQHYILKYCSILGVVLVCLLSVDTTTSIALLQHYKFEVLK